MAKARICQSFFRNSPFIGKYALADSALEALIDGNSIFTLTFIASCIPTLTLPQPILWELVYKVLLFLLSVQGSFEDG